LTILAVAILLSMPMPNCWSLWFTIYQPSGCCRFHCLRLWESESCLQHVRQ